MHDTQVVDHSQSLFTSEIRGSNLVVDSAVSGGYSNVETVQVSDGGLK